MSEALRLESERRARVFNNAVKAAVGKVQRELEAERDELQVGPAGGSRAGLGWVSGEGGKLTPQRWREWGITGGLAPLRHRR